MKNGVSGRPATEGGVVAGAVDGITEGHETIVVGLWSCCWGLRGCQRDAANEKVSVIIVDS